VNTELPHGKRKNELKKAHKKIREVGILEKYEANSDTKNGKT